MNKWQTKEQLLKLLTKMVEIPSVTGTNEEKFIAEYILNEISSLQYFQKYPQYLQLHPTGDGRNFVTALVKKADDVSNTVILISHFDVVDVQDYGMWKNIAFNPQELTRTFYNNNNDMPDNVQEDMKNGDWLFGRGTADMKSGLALHMSMLERACLGAFNGNILLLSVPDEEASSVGMRAAVSILLDLAQQYQLEYTACINSEPIFGSYPGDQRKYIYTGSIGKLLPGFLCFGKETHACEPFSGMNANYMASQITYELELNTEFCEYVDGEVTPPPICLMQKDLKQGYSMQISHHTVILFNLFLMEKQVGEIIDHLIELVSRAAGRIEKNYQKQAVNYGQLAYAQAASDINIKVLTYDQLLKYVINLYGEEEYRRLQSRLFKNIDNQDYRDITVQLVDELAQLCKELWPMVVLFIAPPYYPPFRSKGKLLNQVVDEIKDYTKETHGVTLKDQGYFPGVSDTSYIGLQHPADSFRPLVLNMPLWEKGYKLPLEKLDLLNIPVLNIGPFGKDVHKWTERLEINYSLEILPDVLFHSINKLLK